jgi:V/A-type H+-transporting ATPase subunit C
VKNAKYIPFGIEPLAGYLIAKDNEIKIARIIMAGKLAGISPELIRERLRETYV